MLMRLKLIFRLYHPFDHTIMFLYFLFELLNPIDCLVARRYHAEHRAQDRTGARKQRYYNRAVYDPSPPLFKKNFYVCFVNALQHPISCFSGRSLTIIPYCAISVNCTSSIIDHNDLSKHANYCPLLTL